MQMKIDFLSRHNEILEKQLDQMSASLRSSIHQKDLSELRSQGEEVVRLFLF